jgi:hypothetical protein
MGQAIYFSQSSFVVVGDNGIIIQSAITRIAFLSGSSFSAGSGFQLWVTGEIGRGYRLQTLTIVADPNWTDLFAFTNATATVQLLDPTVTNFSRRFYRAVSP